MGFNKGMLSALVTNLAISSPRGSGLPSDAQRESEQSTLGRGVERADESAGSRQVSARQAGAVPPLTPSAILAVQSLDEAKTASGQTEADPEDAAGTSDEDGAATAKDGRASGSPVSVSGQKEENSATGTSEDEGDADGDGLNDAEEKQVEELKQRDREVRAHEQAHARVGGAYAGSASYTFQQGPDGTRYAVGGEVSIDTSSERTPEATIRKMQVVIRAATAPAEPSSQDLKVAQQARAQLSAAQAEARAQAAEELAGDDEEDASAAANSEALAEPSSEGDADRNPSQAGIDGSSNESGRFSSRAEAEKASEVYALASNGFFGSNPDISQASRNSVVA